jgi:hypothetical protein
MLLPYVVLTIQVLILVLHLFVILFQDAIREMVLMGLYWLRDRLVLLQERRETK